MLLQEMFIIKILENYQDCVLLIRNDRITYVNKAFVRTTGFEKTEVFGSLIWQYFLQNEISEVKENYYKFGSFAIPANTRLQLIQSTGITLPVIPLAVQFEVATVPHVIIALTEVHDNLFVQSELEKSLPIFTSIWENSHDGMRIVDENGIMRLVNPAFCRMTGLQKSEIVGKQLCVIYAQPLRESIQNSEGEKIKTRVVDEKVSHDITLWNNHVAHWEFTNSYITDGDGNTFLLSICRDLTEKKKNTDQMEHKMHLEKIITYISSRYLESSAGNFLDTMQETLTKMAEYLGANAFNLLASVRHTADFETECEWYAATDQIIQYINKASIINIINGYPDIGTQISSFHESLRYGKGKRDTKPISMLFIPVGSLYRQRFIVFYFEKPYQIDDAERNMLETFANILMYSLDKRYAEDELEAEREELKVTLKSIHEGVIKTDIHQTITMVNTTTEEYFRLPAGDITGKNIFEFFLSAGVRKDTLTADAADDSAEPAESANIQYFSFPSDSGNRAIIAMSKSEIIGNAGKTIGHVYILRDVTEQMHEQKKVLFSQKMESIGILAAGIAHEINSPMQFISDNTTFIKNSFTAILDYCNALEQASKQYLPPTASEKLDQRKQQLDIDYLKDETLLAIKESREGIQRINKIIHAMKDFAHPGLKEKTYADLNQSIEVTTTISRNEWKYCSEVVLQLDPDLPKVYCVADEINQVILNMIINARDAIVDRLGIDAAGNGKIIITTKNLLSEIEICIEDNGNGIPKGIIDKIFDPFYTTKQVGKGTGQGLSIAHDIIERKHNGSIRVTSTEGERTTFIITLPVTQPETAIASKTKQPIITTTEFSE